MSNDQIKAGTHPVSNKQSTDSPVQLIMPATSPLPQPHSATGTGKSSGKKALVRARSVDGKERVDEGQGERVQPADEVMSQEQSLASAEAAMSARHVSEEEADVPRADGEDSSERMQLAQADSDSSSNAAAVPAARSNASDAPSSVGEELLRQAAPVPRSREISFLDQLDDWLESDMALPVGLGAAALGFLALSGGGGGGSSGAAAAEAPPPAVEPPRNEWLMTVTPAAGVFLPNATVKLIAKKLMADGSWQEVANSTAVDASGRMTLKVAKGSLTAKDVIRLELSDTDPAGKDYKDEVAGAQTLGGLKLEAYVGAWNADMAVTINPFTTMVVHKLDEAANAANAGGARGNSAVVNDAGAPGSAPGAGGAGAPGNAPVAGGAGAPVNAPVAGDAGAPVNAPAAGGAGAPVNAAAANAPTTPAYGADAAKFEAAIAKAFGIQSGDLLHTIPILLNGRPVAGASADAINYGLALGILSGMTQAQREAGAANPLQAALDLLKSAIQVNGGNVTFALETLRKSLITGSNIDGGLDAGAAKLHAAAVEDGNNSTSTIKGAQVPYLQVDTTQEKPYAGQTKPVWADAAVSFSSFTNGGLSLKVAPAASAKVGDQLLVEFLPLDTTNGRLQGGGAKPFTFKYTYTEKDAEAVRLSAGDSSNNGIGSFTLVVPTFDESAQFSATRTSVLRTATASSTPGSAPSLLDVNNDGVYRINNSEYGYQLRASGAVMGAFASGATLNISTQSIGVEAAPNATGGVLFNGSGVPGASNTVRFSVAIGQKINWSGADPTLEVRVANHPTPLEATLVSGRNADVLTFKLDLTKPANKNLEGALSVAAHALKFSPDTILSDVPGNTLFKTQDGRSWIDSKGSAVADIDAALNVNTALPNSGFSIDTTPPPTPRLTLPGRPAFDANNYAPDNAKPVSGSLNAAPAGAKFGEHAVVTNEPRIPFKVSFDAADNAQLKQGDRVKLVVDFPGTQGREIASASLSKDTGGNWTATFDPASYSENIQQLITRFKTTTDLDKVTFSAVVVDQAGNQSVPGSLKNFAEGGVDNIWIDLKAPAKPSLVALNRASDTGRDDAPDTRADGITSMAKPTLQIEGGEPGGFARVYANADGTGLLGEGRISNGQSLTGGSVNSASVALTGGTGLVNGANTVYVQLIDAAGNKSEIQSKQIEVLLPLPMDARADIALTSTAPHNGFYVTGDVIEVQVTFDREVYLKQGKVTDQLYVNLIQDGTGANAAKILKATYQSGLGKGTTDPGSKVLTFKYTVGAGDDAPAGVKYKVGDLINVGHVLEDKAGSDVPGMSKPYTGAGLTIDTVAPPVPALTLDADLLSHEARATAEVAKGQPLKVRGSEVGSKLAIKLTNASGVVENLDPLTATGAGQTINLTDVQIAKLGDGLITVTAMASDTAGNVRAAAETKFTLDTTAPAVSASVTATGGGQPPAVTKEQISFVVTFNEKLRVPVTIDNFTATNGTVNKVEAVTGAGNTNANSYTVLVTPNPDMPAGNKVELKLKANGATPVLDVAGNPAELGAVIASQAIDTRGPTVISVPADNAPPAPPTMNKDIVFNVRFDEMGSVSQMGNIGVGNFKAINGKVTKVEPVGASRTEYNVTVKPNAELTGNSNEVQLNFFAVADIRMGQGSAGVADSLGNAARDQPNIARQIIDVQQPSITADGVSVSSRSLASGNPDKPGYVHAGDTVRLAVVFDEAVTVSGTPKLNLQVGANTRSASYKTLSTDGKTAYFDYVLTAADTATDGISIPANALQLPTGARITDLAGNAAKVDSSVVALNPAYKVDNSAPTLTEVKVSEMTADNGSGIYKAGSVITVQAKFSEPVDINTTGGAPRIKLTIGGDERTAAYVDRVPGDAPDVLKFSYTVLSGDNAPAGVAIPASPLVLNGASITDVSGNRAVLTLGGVQPNASFKIDTTAPTVTAVAIESASVSGTEGNYRAGDVITAVVTFSEEVKLAPNAQASLNLMVGGDSRTATLVTPTANAASNTLRFSYTLQSADADSNGISIAPNSLALAGVTDKAGNAAAPAHVAVADNPLFKVDNAAPTILSFSTTTPDGTYNIGKVINLRATASEELRPGAKITVTLDNGDTAVLTRDASNRTLLEGSYTVVGGKPSTNDLTVTSFTQAAKDLAGNDLLTTMPAAGKNLGDNRAIVLDAMMPPQPTMFRLDAASDGGASPNDGLISEVLPTFHFDGLVRGATVTVTGTFKGVTQTLLQFTASATAQDQKLTTPLTDGVYTDISVIQTSPSGNASQPRLLGNVTTPGSLELSTAAPGVASQLVFDIDQDLQTEASLETGAPANAPRDFITLIRTPKFNFQGGNDGEVAVLFRDTNGNNMVDAGEQVLGRQIIGVTNATNYRLQPGTSGNGLNGHYVEVAAENALGNGPYTDIKLALQSKYGTYGTAVPMARGATSGSGAGGITVINNKPVPDITGVTTNATAGESSAATMSFNVRGGQTGARIIIKADRLDDNGTLIAAQQEIGRGVPDGNGVLTLQVGQFNGSYGNFKATQDYAGRISNVAVTTVTNTGPQPLGTITWDHLPISVTASTDLAANSRPGTPFTVKFDFSKAPNGFAQDDIAVTGSGVLSAFAPVLGSNNKRYSATFTPTDATVTRATFQVKDGSYTEPNNQSGAASNKLELVFNRAGAVAVSGASADGKPQLGDTLTATVSDPDGVKSDVPVAYVWKAGGVAIVGATGASLRLTDAQMGKAISVEARYTDNLGLAEVSSSASTPNVTGPNAPGVLKFTVNGQETSVVRLGDNVTAVLSDGDGFDPARVTYSWRGERLARPLKGADNATGSTFQIAQDEDVHSFGTTQILVQAEYTDLHGTSERVSGYAYLKYPQRPGTVVFDALNPPNTPYRSGDELHAIVKDDNGTGNGGVTYTWYANDTVIPGQTGSHLQLIDAYRGKAIKVSVSYTDGEGLLETPTSQAIRVEQPNNNAPVGAVTLAGSGELGTTVTASNTITDADGMPGQITYKWFASGDAATKGDLITAPVFVNNDSSKLLITSDLVGKSLKAEANYTDGQGTDEKVLAATAKTAGWMTSVTLGNLSYAQFEAQPQVVSGAKLISRHPTSNVFILDVNGDGQITAADATTYITSLDANGSISFTTEAGRGKATLLAANSPLWATLLPQPAEWGPANGVFGLPARNGQPAVTGGDFWTSTAGTAADSHQVWSKSGAADGTPGAYEQSNASYMNDPNRLHFNVFQVSVLPA